MVDDLQIKLGLDANDLFKGLDDSLQRVTSMIKNLPGVGDAMTSELPAAQAKLNTFVNEQKQLLIAMRLQGQQGTESYQKIEDSIREATQELDKMEKAAKDVNDSIKGIESVAPQSQSFFKSMGESAKGMGAQIKESFNAQSLTAGLAGGIAGGLATGGISAVISGVSAIGSNIFNAAAAADEFGDTLEVAFTQQGITDVEGEIKRVSESTRKLADDLGLPTQRTRELATTVATMGGVSGKQAEELTKLSAGLEVFSGGAVKGEAVALAFSKGMADPEGAAAIEKLAKKYPQLAETLRSNIAPAEKMRIANQMLGQSFKTVADQQGDVGGTFNKLSNAMNAAYETIGVGIMDVMNQIIPIFTEVLAPAFEDLSNTMSGVFERMWSVVQPILALIGGALIAGIVVVINNVMVALNVLYSIWTSVFDAVKNAITPLIDTFKQAFGLDGEVGKGMDVMKMFTDALSFVTDIFKEVGAVVADFGGLLVEFLITPFQIVVEVIADVVRSIAGWLKSNDENTESMKQSGAAAEKTGGFVNWLRQSFDNIRGTIGGVREAFTQVKITLGEFWDAVTQMDINKALGAFTGFSDKLKNAYDKGFNATMDTIKKTREAEAAAEAETTKTKIKPPPGGGGKPKENASELELLKQQYASYAESLENTDLQILANFTGTTEQKAQKEKQLALVRSQTLKEFLNTSLADVKDYSTILTNEQLVLKVQPNKAKKEDFEDIRGFYLDEVGKLSKDLNVDIKVTLGAENDKLIQGELSNLLKRLEEQSKGIELSLDKLIPINPAKTQAELKKVQDAYDGYSQYVKGQAGEIQAAIDIAVGLGDTKTQMQLETMLASNEALLNDAKVKLNKYATDSAKEIERNSGLSGALLALQTALQDNFNLEKLRKEREINDQIRAERLNALKTEEDDLSGSLAKREISFDEYQTKLQEITEQRQAAMEEAEVTFMERMKASLDQTVGNILKTQSAALTTYVQEQFKDAEGKVTESGVIMGNVMGNIATQFGDLALSGKATLADFARSAVMVAYQALQQMIPIFIAEIAGKQFAELGLVGIATAAGLTIALNALFSAAAPALGFKDGVVELQGPGDERSDSIPARLSKGESVITARATRQNKEELEWMNKTGRPISEYFSDQLMQLYSAQERQSIGTNFFENISKNTVSSHHDSQLLDEVRQLRKDTQELGVRISKNTTIDVHGELKVDNKYITAVIENNRRTQSRRG